MGNQYSFFFLNPFLNKPLFLCVCSTNLLKTLWERGNCSERAISPFPTLFSLLFEDFLPSSADLEFSSASSLSGRV